MKKGYHITCLTLAAAISSLLLTGCSSTSGSDGKAVSFLYISDTRAHGQPLRRGIHWQLVLQTQIYAHR